VHDEAHAGGAHRLHLHPGASQLVSTDRSSSKLVSCICMWVHVLFIHVLSVACEPTA
jgi:hypothetical protein